MLKGLRPVLAGLVLLVAAGSAFAEDPKFEGKPASWWAKRLGVDAESMDRARAMVALSRGSDSAVPVLVHLFTLPSSGTTDVSGPQMDAEMILRGLAIHDEGAAPALIDTLVPLLLEDEFAFSALNLLQFVIAARPATHTRMRDALQSILPRAKSISEAYVQDLLIAVTADIPMGLEEQVDAWLGSPRAWRLERHLVSRVDEVVPILLKRIPDLDSDQLMRIRMFLDMKDATGPELIPVLIEVAEDQDSSIRDEARQWAVAVAYNHEIPLLMRIRLYRSLRGMTGYRRSVLARIGGDDLKASDLIPFLTQALSEGDLPGELRFELLRLAAKAPSEGVRPLLPQALAGFEDTHPRVRQASADLIATIGPAAVKAVPRLTAGLRDETSWVPPACARALARVGPEGFRVLEDLVTDSEPLVRYHVVYGLGAVPEDLAARAVPLLKRALRDEDAQVRQRAARSLGRLGPAALPAVDVLIERLDEDPDLLARVAIAGALGDIGPRAKKAVSALMRATEHDDFRLAGAAEKALAKIRRE